MEIFLIFLTLYVILFFTDLLPLIKKKEKKPLLISIPIYLATFVLNTMTSFGTKIPPLNDAIAQMIRSVFRM